MTWCMNLFPQGWGSKGGLMKESWGGEEALPGLLEVELA